MKIKIQKLHENAVTPTYAHAGDACFDLTACTVDGNSHIGKTVYAGAPLICGTGLAFEVPEGQVMLVFSRSGMGFKHDVRLANCVGVIDHKYAGEVMVKLTSDDVGEDSWGNPKPDYKVNIGDRIAQAMIIPVESVDFEVVEQLQLTERGASGFGGSGV